MLQETKLAIEKGDYHQGVPAVTVVVDGGWSKRCHRHSYNAKSSVAVLFGQCMKKLLFAGVRNKYCAVCSVSEKDPPEHRCYCNWSGLSAAMESDIVLESFRLSEQTHSIRYIRIIGDGDRSVLATLQQSVIYGPFIQKIECANHVCKGVSIKARKVGS